MRGVLRRTISIISPGMFQEHRRVEIHEILVELATCTYTTSRANQRLHHNVYRLLVKEDISTSLSRFKAY